MIPKVQINLNQFKCDVANVLNRNAPRFEITEYLPVSDASIFSVNFCFQAVKGEWMKLDDSR